MAGQEVAKELLIVTARAAQGAQMVPMGLHTMELAITMELVRDRVHSARNFSYSHAIASLRAPAVAGDPRVIRIGAAEAAAAEFC